MPKPGADLVVMQKHRRAWTQRGGPTANNPLRYAGADETYLSIDDDDNPITGGRTPVRVHDPRRRAGGAYQTIGETTAAPDFPTATINFMHRHGGIPFIDFDAGCFNNIYEVVGPCKRPDDFIGGWSDYVKIYSYGRANGKGDTGNTTYEDDNATMTSAEMTFSAIYKIGGLNFGSAAGTEVEREVVGVAFGGGIDCGNCGPGNDGTQWIYAVTKSSGAASPGTPAEVVYSTDGGLTWSNQNITGLGGTVDPTGIAVVGSYLVVLDTAGLGYWFADINPLTGVPANWTQVTTGFVTAKAPNDVYAAAPNEVYFVGDGGYIYLSQDIPSGVTVLNAGSATTADLQRIHGQDDTLVAVGESGAIVISQNRGATFATATLSPTSATLRAVLALDAYRLWVGTSGGKVYYSINGGETWSEQTLPGGTLTVIDDIVAATDEVIHIAARTATPTGRLITSWCGGEKWASSAANTARIASLPTASRYNRIAVPRSGVPTVDSNTIVLGGLAGSGVDGVLALGKANKV